MDSKSMHFKYVDLKSKFKFKFMFLNATLATSKHYMSKKKKTWPWNGWNYSEPTNMGDIHQYSVTLFNTNWIFVFWMTDLDTLKQERWYHQRFKTQAAKVASTLQTNDTYRRAKQNLQQHCCNLENYTQQFWLLLHAIYNFLIFKDSWDTPNLNK